jgi:hypothetical protein
VPVTEVISELYGLAGAVTAQPYIYLADNPFDDVVQVMEVISCGAR